jgi:hypothetical protein
MCDGAITLGSKTWDPTSKQFKYQTGVPWPPLATGGTWFVNVNPWLAQAFAWVYKQTGNTVYKTWADDLFIGMVQRVNTPGTNSWGSYNNGGGTGNLNADDQALNQFGVAWAFMGLIKGP